jgi:hypothetical protein
VAVEKGPGITDGAPSFTQHEAEEIPDVNGLILFAGLLLDAALRRLT